VIYNQAFYQNQEDFLSTVAQIDTRGWSGATWWDGHKLCNRIYFCYLIQLMQKI